MKKMIASFDRTIKTLTILSVVTFYLSWNIDAWFISTDLAYVVDILFISSIVLGAAIVALFSVSLKKYGFGVLFIISTIWGAGVVGSVVVVFIQRSLS